MSDSLLQTSDTYPQADESDADKTSVLRSLDELEGEIISSRYQIIRRIGRGGMGVVYLAQQTNLNRNVCLKVLNPALLDDADAVGRFEREAKGLSRLQHPNIVTIFDYGRDGNLAYIVMEYAQGITLSKYIKANAPLDRDKFVPIAAQILRGIGEAHKLGLIHRDIKPANIILSELEGEQNFVKILDFGLAKLVQGQEDLTKEQQLVGSASYMAPEQITIGQSDTRTDVYALGVLFYFMLSGSKPFTGPNDNVVLYKHVNEHADPLFSHITPDQGVPESLCEVIDQCLNKNPDKRPQTATDLLNAISYALDAPQIRAGFSSMSMPPVDTVHNSGAEMPSVMQMRPELPPEHDPDPMTPSDTTVSDIVPDMTISEEENIVDDPSFSPKDVSQMSPKQIKDRRLLLILLASIITAVALLTLILINAFNNNTTPKVVQNNQAAQQNNDIKEDLSKIEAFIKEGEISNADNLITSIENKLLKDNKDTSILLPYKTDIKILKLLKEASISIEDKDYDAALNKYNDILSNLDTNNVVAENGRNYIEALKAEKDNDFHLALSKYVEIQTAAKTAPEIGQQITSITNIEKRIADINNMVDIFFIYPPSENTEGIKITIDKSEFKTAQPPESILVTHDESHTIVFSRNDYEFKYIYTPDLQPAEDGRFYINIELKKKAKSAQTTTNSDRLMDETKSGGGKKLMESGSAKNKSSGLKL